MDSTTELGHFGATAAAGKTPTVTMTRSLGSIGSHKLVMTY